MGGKGAFTLLVIGGLVFFIIGLPVTGYILLYSPSQYPTSSLVVSFLFSVLFFILIPFWMMKKGFTKYRTATRMEKEKREYQSQLERESRALELEKIKQRRREIAETGTREIPPVTRQEMTKEREKVIIKEIVKIKCRYCGKLHDERLDRCPHCGA